jgi:hypothetical protein
MIRTFVADDPIQPAFDDALAQRRGEITRIQSERADGQIKALSALALRWVLSDVEHPSADWLVFDGLLTMPSKMRCSIPVAAKR